MDQVARYNSDFLKALRSPEQFQAATGFALRQPVQWGEMDAFQHLNNVMYFRYFESARVAFFRQSTEFFKGFSTTGLGPILGHTECRYLVPVVWPDAVWVSARFVAVGESEITVEHLLFSENLNRVTAMGSATIVTFDYASQKRKVMPRDIRDVVVAAMRAAHKG